MITTETTQKALKESLNAVRYAMARKDVRDYLNGVYAEASDSLLKLTATDGHKLATTTIKADTDGQATCIIPASTVRAIIKALKVSNKTPVRLIMDSDIVQLWVLDDCLFAHDSIDGKYPDYNRVIPDHQDWIKVDRKALLSSAEELTKLCRVTYDGYKRIEFRVTGDQVEMAVDKVFRYIDIADEYRNLDRDNMGFRLNGPYLVQTLKAIKTPIIYIYAGGPTLPIKIIPDDESSTHLIMPMKK